MFVSYVFQSTLVTSQSVMFVSFNFMIYTKIIRLHLNVSR